MTLDHTAIQMYNGDGIREFYKTMRELFTAIDQRLDTFNLNCFEGYVPNLLQMNTNMKNLYLAHVNYIRKHITFFQTLPRNVQIPEQFKQLINQGLENDLGINTDVPIQVTVKEDWSDDKKAIIRAFPHIPVVTLNNLKFMEIKDAKNVLYWLEAPNLETMIIKNYCQCPGVNEFLKTCEKSLKNLTIEKVFINYVENLDNLKLKKLEVGIPSNLLNESEYINFLMTQVNSLRELTIHFHIFNPQSIIIIDYINKHFNLTKLSVICEIETIISSSGIKQIISEPHIENFIIKCEKVTTLNLDFTFLIDFDIISHFQQFMPNLKSLTIHPYLSTAPLLGVLNGLDTLEIINLRKEIPNRTKWYEIALECPNIKKLSLVDNRSEISTINLKSVLESSSELRILNLYFGNKEFQFCDNFFSIFLGDRINVLRINVYARMGKDKFNKKIEILRDNMKIQTVYQDINYNQYKLPQF